MHLLHRHTMFGGGDGDLRLAGGSPRAAPRLLLSKGESMKKRSTKKKSGTKGSKRARLRAGLAAALRELMLAGRKRGPVHPAANAFPSGSEPEVACCGAADAAAGPSCASGPEAPANGPSRGRGATGMGGRRAAAWTTTLMPLVLVLALALACVVALGRAPAVGCCTACAAWWCRGAASDGRRRRSSSLVAPHAGAGGGGGNRCAARRSG